MRNGFILDEEWFILDEEWFILDEEWFRLNEQWFIPAPHDYLLCSSELIESNIKY